jgi:hypothetical protein
MSDEKTIETTADGGEVVENSGSSEPAGLSATSPLGGEQSEPEASKDAREEQFKDADEGDDLAQTTKSLQERLDSAPELLEDEKSSAEQLDVYRERRANLADSGAESDGKYVGRTEEDAPVSDVPGHVPSSK